MLPPPGNGVGVGAGFAGATPLPGASNLGFIGLAPPGCDTRGGSPGLAPTAALPRSHVYAGNMQQPGAHPTANNEYIRQM